MKDTKSMQKVNKNKLTYFSVRRVPKNTSSSAFAGSYRNPASQPSDCGSHFVSDVVGVLYGRCNPGTINARTALRRAIKLQATPFWLTKEQKREIRAFYIEAARLTKETGIKHQVDHIVPLQGKTVTGLHVPWNLQILTASQNAAKGNRIPSNLTL